MSNAVFPTLPGLSWGVRRTPVWKTVSHESVSGMELRASLMSYPRWRIGLSFEFLRSANAYMELQTLVGFFNQRRGSWDSFLWRDPGDFSTTFGSLGTADGVTKAFTLSRSYGGFLEPVQDFISGPSVYVGGVLKSSPADYSVSMGKVTFVTAPAAGAALVWTGQFYKRVRFERDETEFEEFLKDLHSARRIDLITVKQ